MNHLSDKEKEILANFGKAIPLLSETGKERLLSFGEDAVLTAEELHKKKKEESPDGF